MSSVAHFWNVFKHVSKWNLQVVQFWGTYSENETGDSTIASPWYFYLSNDNTDDHGRRKDFFQGGALEDFSKIFPGGGQKWWNLFFPTQS